MQYSMNLTLMCHPLITWYKENRRMHPWREDPTPYHVWISEIMLQQTRIEAVIPYYHRFLATFPDAASLATADDDKLMKLWEGLGYYSRARNLKKAAVMIMEQYGGKLPEEAKELEKLPGIGAYTAGAIAAICFHKPTPAVDGNVLRVITRVLGSKMDIMAPATKKLITEELSAVYLKGEDAKYLTESIMELGEVICIPNGEPKCHLCPLRDLCVAYRNNLTDEIPVKAPKKARKIEKRTVLLLSCREKYAIRRRPETGILARLWEFPNIEGHLTEEALLAHLHEFRIFPVSLHPAGEAVHIFTHMEWHMQGFAVECAEETPHFSWHTAEEIKTKYAIPTAFRAYSKQLE